MYIYLNLVLFIYFIYLSTYGYTFKVSELFTRTSLLYDYGKNP